MIDWQNVQRDDQWQSFLKLLTALSYRSPDLSRYLHEIARGVSQLLKADWSIVTLHEGSSGQIVASSVEIEDAESGFLVHESVSEIVVRSGQPFLIEDINQCPEEASRMAGYVCYLGVPLRTVQGEVIGTICSFSRQPQHYDAAIIATAELFAERAATAIDNHQLYQQQQQFNHLLEAEVNQRTMELSIAQAKLIEHERLAAIGEFAAMIVHEIRNPLTTIQMGLDYFAKLDLSQPAQTRLSLATAEAERLANLLQEVLSYSKPQILQLVKIDIDAFIQELLISLRSLPEVQGRLIEYIPSPAPIQIVVDPSKLKQVFINLIRNACEAIEVGETIRWAVTESPVERICISIQNGGALIPADTIPRLTQPFYSTKAEGIGLGLAIVKQIVKAHSGELLIESSETKGTVFSIRLPLKQEVNTTHHS